MPNYWLLKTEPTTYSYDRLVQEGRAVWDGVRNNLALSHIRNMKQGDRALIYHSGAEKAVIGLAKVASPPYADPNQNDPKLTVVDLVPDGRLANPVTLSQIKADGGFGELPLVRMPRLSVMPLPAEAWKKLLAMGGK